MPREFKFRAWDGKRMLNRTLYDRNWYTDDDKCIRKAMPHDSNMLEVMQYTGLKDKKSVEVYEGDITKIECGNLIVVEFLHHTHHWRDFWGYDIHPDAIVIGNIHQHPNLLITKKVSEENDT